MKKIILLTFLFFTLLYGTDPIRIVYNTDTPPLKFTDIENKPNGMLIDIWKLWASKNNLSIEFIEASWDESLQMIQDESADIHAGLYYTKEREKFLDYTTKPLYNNRNYFFYDTTFLNVEKIDDLKPFVVGISNGYPNEFMEKNYPDFKVQTYKSSDAASKAFLKGEVKVVLSAMPTLSYFLQLNKFNIENYKYNDISYAFTKHYYGAVKQGNKKLLKRIDEGFTKLSDQELKQIEKKWTSELSNYYLQKEYAQPILNEKQKKYLQEKKVIKMCVDPKWLPFEAIEEGKHIGIVADIFALIEKQIDIPIELVQTTIWNESLQAIQDGKCDILAAATQTTKREKYLQFTKPYLYFPQVIVTQGDTPFIEEFQTVIGKKIGVVKNSGISDILQEKYPNINLVDVQSVSDGLLKVSQGELYGFINTSAAVSYYIAKEGLTNLKIAAKVGIEYKIRTAIKDDLLLLSVFEDVIEKLNPKAIQQIKDNWLQVKVQEVVDYAIIYKTVLFFVVIIGVILLWNKQLKNEINQRKRLQKELAKVSQVIEQSNVSVIITNTEGEIEYINPFCIKQCRYSKKELIGANPSILKSGYHDERFYQELWGTITNGQTWQGELANKTKDGKIFWESAVIAPIFDKSGSISYYASIKENIDDKVQAREELQAAQAEAIAANSAKSEFLAKMSHEIRTPMNAVLGMLYLLEKTEISSVQENYIKKANHAANSLLGLINDILDFSKIEAGKLTIHSEEFEFNEMIMDILSVMSFKAEEKNIELLAHYDPDIPPYIKSDKLRLGQILNNLLSNAIKFTNSGEVVVTTRLIAYQGNNIKIMFCVKDTGIGLSKESQDELFEEFLQVDNSATRTFEGTGLGLVICKKLAKLLGGDIWIESSKPDVGSTFCFTIEARKSSKKAPYLQKLDSIKNLKVLVVDDNQSAIDVLSAMLESFGYTVSSAKNGKVAIELIKQNDFDLLLLDYKMEPLNGIETYKIAYDEIKKKNMKTIMVSAYSSDIVDQDLSSLQIQGYLSKPVSPSTLYNKILELYNGIDEDDIGEAHQSIEEEFEQGEVLLVEDNKLNQEFTSFMLQEKGLNVDIANDGLEALQKIQQKQYDIILMDIQMPNMDGLEATKQIRKMKGDYFQNVPIIALSANALLGDKEKSLKVGMDEHVTKPIDPDHFFKVLGEFLDSKKKVVQKSKKAQVPQLVNILDKGIFDVKKTLKKLNNSEDIYIKILKQFSSNYKDSYSKIDQLIHSDDIVQLKSKVHEIKGVSGNIGAFKLYEKLIVIDRIVKKDAKPSSKLLKEFELELEKVLEAIDKLQEQKIEKKSFDKEKVVMIVQNIYENLEEDLARCEEYLEQLLPYLEEEHKQFANTLSEDLNNFDTDKVKQDIENFLQGLK